MSIIQSFPGTPRDVQRETLEHIEQNWNSHDIFVADIPVGGGKSRIALTVAKWASKKKLKTSIITPNNLLVGQYLEANPKIHHIHKKSTYVCQDSAYAGQTKPPLCQQIKASKKKRYCVGCPYVSKLRQMRVVPYGVYNYYTYMAHRIYRDVLVVDEAHNLLKTLQELNARRLWRHEWNFPSWVTNYAKLFKWLKEHPQRDESPTLRKVWEDLNQREPNYIIERTLEDWRGQEKECLKISPVDLSKEKNPFFPSGVKKIVLMSGTINALDIEQLGLKGKRVAYIKGKSPIPPERRPVVYWDRPVNCSFAYQTENIKKVADIVEELANTHEGRGFIHVPYGMSPKLKRYLRSERFLSHERDDKKLQFERFLSSNDSILLASGFSEGIDLAGETARWQVIVKVPWPSLAEPAIRELSKRDPDRYAWSTIKEMVQASGRISRGPEDFGVTYILDSTFETLYSEHSDLFPDYFRDALVRRGRDMDDDFQIQGTT